MNERGFTLVEVLVSLVILTGGVLLIAQGVSGGVRGAGLSLRQSQAALLADGMLARIEAGEFHMDREEEGDFVEEGFPSFGWRIDGVSQEYPGLYLVTVDVFWTEGVEEREVRIHRLMNERSESIREVGEVAAEEEEES